MYYEEKLINGVWHWRGLPTEDFKPMDLWRLHHKITDAEDRLYHCQQQLTEANRRGEELRECLERYGRHDEDCLSGTTTTMINGRTFLESCSCGLEAATSKRGVE